MTDPDSGKDRAGRRSKRFLTPIQKYGIFLQLALPLHAAIRQWPNAVIPMG